MWGAGDALADILKVEAANEKASKDKQKPNGILRLLRNHPSARERLKVLQEPHRLFLLTPDLPFVTGILLAFAIPGISFVAIALIMLFGSPVMYSATKLLQTAEEQGNASLIPIIQALLLAAVGIFVSIIGIAFFTLSFLIVRTLILQILREAVEKSVRWGKKSFGGGQCLKTAILFGCGYEAGFFISPFAAFAPRSPAAAMLLVLCFPATVGLIWLVMLYARHFGVRLFTAHLGKAVPHWKLRFWLLIVSALLILPLLSNFVVRLLLQNNNAETLKILTGFLIFTLFGSILPIAFAFCGSWLSAKIWRLAAPQKCESCNQKIARNYAPGDFCGNCGRQFADWLFVEI
jgi:hypothetical protein